MNNTPHAYQPIDYARQQYVSHFNTQPSAVKGLWNAGTQFYKRLLYNKVYSCYEFELPQDWALNWFRFWLFHYGSIGVVYSHEYGWVCQPYSPLYYDYQYQPSTIVVANSHFKKVIYGQIGENAYIIRCFDDFYGFDSIVTRYAEMLAQCDRSINVNLMNSNVSYVFEAKSKKNAQEIKTAYQKATEGEPLVVVNEKVLDGNSLVPLIPQVKNNFIAPSILESRRAIINAFLTEIGIRNVSVQKKERLTSGETNENNDETRAIVSVVYENLKYSMERTNEISGLNLRVNLRYDYTNTDISESQLGAVNYGTNNA